MTVCMCCTSNWYYYLLINIYALISTNKVKKIYLIVEDDKIEEIKDICKSIKVEFININKIGEYVKQSSPNYNTKYSKLSMCRLYFTKILKEDKILYIDADAIVIDDINELWNTKFENNVLIGVKESGEWDKHLNTTGLDNKYINSGVLLMNLKALREEELDESMLYLINNNKYAFPDQDVINLVCRNRIGYVLNEYNSSETTGIPEHIRIMHYIRGNKGWIRGSNNSEIWKEWETKTLKEKDIKEKMKKIRALQNYTDTVLNKYIVKGDEYIVDNERAEAITNYIFKGNPLAEIIEIVKEEVKEVIKESNKEDKPKKTSKKKVAKK